jgi:hypothetical protein
MFEVPKNEFGDINFVFRVPNSGIKAINSEFGVQNLKFWGSKLKNGVLNSNKLTIT